MTKYKPNCKNDYNYYTRQLKGLGNGNEYDISVKLWGDNDTTQTLSLNKDSIEAILAYAKANGIIKGYNSALL